MKDLIGVINDSGELVGVFSRADFAEAFLAGLYAEQMHVAGCILIEYSTVPIDASSRIGTMPWKETGQ